MKLLSFERNDQPDTAPRIVALDPAIPGPDGPPWPSPIYLSRYDHHRLRSIVALEKEGTELLELRRELDRAIVVPEHARMPGFVVTMDTEVFLEDQESGSIQQLVVTWPENADPGRGAVPVIDALGTALLGCSQGDVVTFTSDGTRRNSKIVRVVQSSVAEAAASLSVASFS